MVQPGKRSEAFEFLSFQHLPRIVESKPGHQDLIAVSERHDPRAGIDLNAEQVLGSARSLVFLNENLAHVNADAIEDRRGGSLGQTPQPGLQQQTELHRIGRLGEDDEKGVARCLDLLRFVELAEKFPGNGMMLLDQEQPLLVSKALLEFGRADNVREQQSGQPGAMAASKFLDLRMMFEDRVEVHRLSAR